MSKGFFSWQRKVDRDLIVESHPAKQNQIFAVIIERCLVNADKARITIRIPRPQWS